MLASCDDEEGNIGQTWQGVAGQQRQVAGKWRWNTLQHSSTSYSALSINILLTKHTVNLI